MSARAREGKRNETRARRREAKRAGESRDAIDDEVSSRCIASRIARSLHTFCKSSCIDRSIRRRSRASRASRPSRARIPHRDAREARRRRASAEGCARERPRTSSIARFTPRSRASPSSSAPRSRDSCWRPTFIPKSWQSKPSVDARRQRRATRERERVARASRRETVSELFVVYSTSAREERKQTRRRRSRRAHRPASRTSTCEHAR